MSAFVNPASQPAFAGRSWKLTPEGRTFVYRHDPVADVVFCDPLPTDEELAYYYGTIFDYQWYYDHRYQKRIQGWHRWKRTSGLLEGSGSGQKRLLDIGCGHGWYVLASSKGGWKAEGLDYPSETSLATWRRLGIQVTQGTIESAPLRDGQFDAITMWHALEHTKDPEATIGHVLRRLAPGGKLLIAVPNLACRGFRLKGADWTWIQLPYLHIWHFSAKSLSALLERQGMSVEVVETSETWDAQWWFDGLREQKMRRLCYGYIGGIAYRCARLCGRNADAARNRLGTFAHECARILVYGATILAGRRPSVDGTGSELLVVARKMSP